MNTIQPITQPVQPNPKQEITLEQESNFKNTVQYKKEQDYQDSKPELTDIQTLAVKTNSANKQIDAYMAGSGNSSNDVEVKLSEDYSESVKSVELYQNLQETSKKNNAIQAYQRNTFQG